MAPDFTHSSVVTAGSVDVDCTLICVATFCSRAALARARASNTVRVIGLATYTPFFNAIAAEATTAWL